MTEKMILKCVAPYDFGLSMSLFSNGDTQIRRFEEGRFWQVVKVDHKLVMLTLRAVGSVDRPRIMIGLSSTEEISEEEKRNCLQLSRMLVDADFDLGPFYSETSKDETLRQIAEKLRGLKVPSTTTVYEALIDTIIEQQISLNVAHVLQKNLIKKFGDHLNISSKVYYSYPDADKLASISTERLRQIGLSTKKAEYVRNVSRMVALGKLDLEAFRNYASVSEIIEELDAIRGIGKWTAELTAVRGLQRYDAIPADDLGLRRVIAHFYRHDEKITGDEARQIAEKWGKWRGLASFYLVMAETTGLFK